LCFQGRKVKSLESSPLGQTFVAARKDGDPIVAQRGAALRAAIAAAVVGMFAGGVSSARAHTPTTQVTWTVDVEPILRARCVRCHQTGGFGPMSLATYDGAKPWAAAIRNEVLSRRMPPWSAVPGFGDFTNDASLSPVEAELIARWVAGGAPHGPEVVTRAAPARVRADRVGALRLELPAFAPSTALVQRVTLPTPFADERWISGWEFEAGDRSLVEEAIVSIDETAIGSWTPFDAKITYPRGVAERLPARAGIGIDVRYRKTSEPKIDRSALTLYFGRRPSHALRHLVVGCGSHTIDGDMNLLAVKPRPVAAGDGIEVVAHGADGAVTPVAVVSRYRPEYDVTYRLRAPLHLARGWSVDIRASSPECTAALDYVERRR